MMSVSTNLKDVIESMANVTENLPREIYSALGKASTKTKSALSKEVAKELATKQKIIKDQIKTHKDRQELSVTISLLKSVRIPLRDFGARQTKKGVTAKISKTKGRKTYQSAFKVTKIGDHVFKRTTTKRFPIQKLKGPSPWGVMVKNPDKIADVVEISRQETAKAMSERLRYLNLKKSGGLNWQQANENEGE